MDENVLKIGDCVTVTSLTSVTGHKIPDCIGFRAWVVEVPRTRSMMSGGQARRMIHVQFEERWPGRNRFAEIPEDALAYCADN